MAKSLALVADHVPIERGVKVTGDFLREKRDFRRNKFVTIGRWNLRAGYSKHYRRTLRRDLNVAFYTWSPVTQTM